MSRTESGIIEHGKPHRLMAVWTAAHDNGWVTSVVENPDGSFAAWAAPDGEGAGVYTIQADVDSGKAAAEAALQRHTGHDGCSNGCKPIDPMCNGARPCCHRRPKVPGS